jgi:hypothetical protein
VPEVLRLPDETQPIVPETVRDTFQEAFRVFAEDIWFENHVPRVGDYPYFVKTGAIFVHTGPRVGKKRIEISSLHDASLKSFTSFLGACGAIDKIYVERVFAPEEVLLTPYFAHLRSTFEKLINDERNQPQLYDLAEKAQAAENVKSELFADAIRRFANVIKRDRAVFQERIEQIKTQAEKPIYIS